MSHFTEQIIKTEAATGAAEGIDLIVLLLSFHGSAQLSLESFFDLVSLLPCGFGTFSQHALFISSIWQFSSDATQFVILEDGSCLLFCFTLIGQGSDTHHSVLPVGE